MYSLGFFSSTVSEKQAFITFTTWSYVQQKQPYWAVIILKEYHMNYPGQISEVNICKNMAYLQIRQVKVSFTSISHDLEQEMDLITFSFDMHLLFI